MPAPKREILTFQVPGSLSFTISRATWLWTILHQFSVVGKIPTGDASFDEEYFIRSPDVAWARVFFADAETRRLVRALFGLRCASITLAGGMLKGFFPYGVAVEEGNDALDALAARLPRA